MIAAISRLTTDYVDTEDRLRLSGDIAGGAPVAMWMTQRLALRLLPQLLQWLDSQIGAATAQGSEGRRSAAPEIQKQVVHGFAQEAALADLTPQARVQAAASEGWLIQSVDIARSDERVALVFRTADGRAAGLGVTAHELRQWLAIMRGVWLAAGWPDTPWPEWMKGEARPAERQIVLH
jgi:hypothetical protein